MTSALRQMQIDLGQILLDDPDEFIIRVTRPTSYMDKAEQEGAWFVLRGANMVTYFTLICMPGCCGVCISTGAYQWVENEHGESAFVHIYYSRG